MTDKKPIYELKLMEYKRLIVLWVDDEIYWRVDSNWVNSCDSSAIWSVHVFLFREDFVVQITSLIIVSIQ